MVQRHTLTSLAQCTQALCANSMCTQAHRSCSCSVCTRAGWSSPEQAGNVVRTWSSTRTGRQQGAHVVRRQAAAVLLVRQHHVAAGVQRCAQRQRRAVRAVAALRARRRTAWAHERTCTSGVPQQAPRCMLTHTHLDKNLAHLHMREQVQAMLGHNPSSLDCRGRAPAPAPSARRGSTHTARPRS